MEANNELLHCVDSTLESDLDSSNLIEEIEILKNNIDSAIWAYQSDLLTEAQVSELIDWFGFDRWEEALEKQSYTAEAEVKQLDELLDLASGFYSY